MSLPDVLGIILSLLSIGIVVVTALVRSQFVGLRSRMDNLEREVRADYNSCMDKIVDLNKRVSEKR